ncbi:MAG: hypothetical protein ACM3XN_03670 [Chloroflexota bacterium]
MAWLSIAAVLGVVLILTSPLDTPMHNGMRTAGIIALIGSLAGIRALWQRIKRGGGEKSGNQD